MTDECTGLREYSVSVELAVDLTDKLAAIVNRWVSSLYLKSLDRYELADCWVIVQNCTATVASP